MIICQHCHLQTDDGSVFCENCGHDLAPSAQHFRTPMPVSGGALPAPVMPAPTLPTRAPSERDQRRADQTNTPPIIALRLANGRRLTLSGQREYTIGRASPEHPRPDVDLGEHYGPQAGVSREHLKIRVDVDGVFVQDLVSTNETVQNGYRLMPQQWYPLRDGDELRLGAIILYVSVEQPRP